jgi:hypothetical protein
MDTIPPTLLKAVKKVYEDLYELTNPKCGQCRCPHSCCSPEYCELAFQHAKKLGIELQPTGHPKLPLMGPNGCVAEPYLRPLCAVHVCENHIYSDLKFYDDYRKLREKASMLSIKAFGLDD